MHPERTEVRGGPLRNGNRRGDPNLAPRCGAKARTTGCPCRAPAMQNGRCRLHGGKATGPRTAAGLARLAATHTKHGGYSKASNEVVRRISAFITEMRALRVSLRQGVVPVMAPAATVRKANARPVAPGGDQTPCNVKTDAS